MFNPLKFISKFIKSSNQKELDRIGKVVNQTNFFEENVRIIKDEEFPKKTEKLREKLQNGQSLDQILPEAFALVR